MTELAVLTKEQAEAIETISEAERIPAILLHARIPNDWCGERTSLNGIDADTFIRALYVGYTVEKTQEEREADVKAYYDSLLDEYVKLSGLSHKSVSLDAKLSTIRRTLDLLGIHVEGVTK